VAVEARTWDDLLEGEELAYLTEEAAREPRLAPVPEELDPRVRAAIGVDALYAHQAEAWEAAARGEHLIVTTGTASGKTLAFNLPVLDTLARDPKSRALYLYPTKALAQDQHRTLAGYRIPKLKPAIYDGDTPGEQRWQVRKWANVILSNPDMLHVGVLPRHDAWGDVLSNLRVRDRGRGARLPRRLRVARRERPPAAAPARARLRGQAAVSPRLRDDREPGRARALAARARRDRDRRRRSAARGADDRALESAAPRRGARPAREAHSGKRRACSPTSSGADCGRSASPRAARPPS